jgi:agmatine deiminase
MHPVPEWERHRVSLLCWPGRTEVWGGLIESARDEYAALARCLSQYEPTVVFANEAEAHLAADRCGPGVEVEVMPSDDAWLRDTGPVFCRRADGQLVAALLRFNAWGGKYAPHDEDAALGSRVAAYLDLPTVEVDVVGEGGAIANDGRRIFSSESVLLNENRNPGISRTEVERRLRSGLGAEQVLWISSGLHDDLDTDGHIDNLVWLADEATAFLLEVPPGHPDADVLRELRNVLDDHGFVVVAVPDGCRSGAVGGSRAPLSMLNCYAVNGALIVPVPDEEGARAAVERFQPHLDSREVRAVISPVMAFGGGGVHCVTLGVPS